MSGEAAANVLWTVGQSGALRDLTDPTEEEIAAIERRFKQPILDQYEKESSPYFATARLWDDGILDPLQTRTALGLAFAVTVKAPFPSDRYGTFRM
jgi:3-methylcrotonyl-CoA carboxylase beta subunit